MPSIPKVHGQPMIRRDPENNSIHLEVVVSGANEAETKWYVDDREIVSGTEGYEMTAQKQPDQGTTLFGCEIKEEGAQGTYKAVFANNDGIFKVKFGIVDTSGLCRHTDTNFEACRLYTKTNFDRTDFTHDHRFCLHEH